MRSLFRHILYHREIYLYPLLAIALTVGAIAGVPLLTGRSVIDDPAAIVGWLYNFCGIVLVALLVGQVQTHLFGYRSDLDSDHLAGVPTPPPPFRDDIFDACVTAFLFLLFAWLLWH